MFRTFSVTRLFSLQLSQASRVSNDSRLLFDTEELETRILLTANLFIDYGDNFPGGVLSTTQGALRDIADDPIPGNRILGVPLPDSSGFNAATPLDIVAQSYTATDRAEALAIVQRAYLGLDINVVELTSTNQTTADGRVVQGAASMTDVINTLRGGDTTWKDAYIFVGTFIADPGGANEVIYGGGGGGLSPSNTLGETSDLNSASNLHDDVAVVYDTGAFFSNNTINNISHEAGHNFGLRHAITNTITSNPTNSVAPAAINLFHQAEIMSYQNTNSTTSSVAFTRYPTLRGDGNSPGTGVLQSYNDLSARAGQVTNHDQLRLDANVGANPNFHFVSGTGAHDIITITSNGANADVTIQSFANAARTIGITVPGETDTTYSFSIPLDKDILVQAGGSNDQIVIVGDLGVNVQIDGMLGTDSLSVTALNAFPYVARAPMPSVDLIGGTPTTDYGGTVTVGSHTITINNFEPGSNIQVIGSTNDDFVDAIDLGSVSSVTDTSNNTLYTGEAGEPAQSGTIDSAWWSWTAPTDGNIVVDTNGSNFNTYLTMATGTAVNALTVIEQDDNDGAGTASLISQMVTAGTVYHFAVDGFLSNTGDITLNVNFTPTSFSGTTGDDIFVFDASGANYVVTVNGISYTLDPAITPQVDIDGLAGNDKITYVGGAAADMAILNSGSLTVTKTGFMLDAVSVETIVAIAVGGNDSADLFDSAGDDSFVGTPTKSTMTGPGFSHEVLGFASVKAHATAGNDNAQFHDSIGNDFFVGTPTTSTMTGPGFANEVTGFASVKATATTGNDIAQFDDSAGDDSFVGTPTKSTMTGTGFSNEALGFDSVKATATAGNDTGLLKDSAGNDFFMGAPTTSTMIGIGFSNEVTGFDLVKATATTGSDTALLYDSAGDDSFVGTSTKSTMSGPGFSNEVTGFDLVKATATAGNDTAQLNDSAGDNSFVGTPTTATMTGVGFSNEVTGFDSVKAKATTGIDTAQLDDSAGDDSFVSTPTKSTMSGAGYSNEVTGFDSVKARATTGNDTAQLDDSAGNDSFVASQTTSTMTGFGFSNEASGFDSVIANASTGNDSTQFTGTTGNDAFTGREKTASMKGSGYSFVANNFDKVVASGLAGTDLARFYDSKSNDRYFGNSSSSRLVGSGYFNQADGFEKVRVFASKGTDKARLTDSAGADVFVGKEKKSRLTGKGYKLIMGDFDEVHVKATNGGKDSAKLFGSAKNDAFVAKPTKAKLSSKKFLLNVNGFDRVKAFAGKGNKDTAVLTGSSMGDKFLGRGSKGTLSGSGFLLFTKNFDKIKVNGKGNVDVLDARNKAYTLIPTSFETVISNS